MGNRGICGSRASAGHLSFWSGMCFSLGRHPVKRGLILTGCGLIITLVTVLVMPESIVIMGVLNFFGVCHPHNRFPAAFAPPYSGLCRHTGKLSVVSADQGGPVRLSWL